MVKKINGKKPPKKTSGVKPTKGVERGKEVSGAKEVGSVEGKQSVSGTGGVGRKISAKDREQIFKLVTEEADKLFGPDGLPASKRETIEGAVKKAIDSGIIIEEDER